jgi:SSS family transporter
VTVLDWAVVGAYLAGMLALSAWLGLRQKSREDYYLGGKRMSAWSLAASTIATQCSTNSLLGAPAFVGFAVGGGMLWLQYELAVPLAMLALFWVLGPIRARGHVSVYAFLEERLGLGARLLASASFQLFRGVATGVTVYGVGSVLTLVTDLTYLQAVVVLMGVTVVYDVLGGMRAVVLSDVVQLLLLSAAVLYGLWTLVDATGVEAFLTPRAQALDFHWGVGGSGNYGFWPMLLGGFFLYAAYYGCDQSQAQRVLSASSEAGTQRVLLLNGLLRFPLVLAYCLLGLGLAAWAGLHPGFLESLPRTADGAPNVNLAFPYYVLQTFAPGFVGLVLVGLFAAAMSSIDSALNSLSAVTVEDYLGRFTRLSERQLFLAAKGATVFWGAFAVFFSFQVEAIAPTVLEAINKVSSMVNGPLLALFLVALVAPATGQVRAIAGFLAGLAGNAVLWAWFPGVSWLWWNPCGCLVALAVALVPVPVPGLGGAAPPALPHIHAHGAYVGLLLAMTVLILGVCLGFQGLA